MDATSSTTSSSGSYATAREFNSEEKAVFGIIITEVRTDTLD